MCIKSDIVMKMFPASAALLPLIFICQTGFCQNYEYDKKIGYETSIKIELTMGLYEDSIKTDYLNSVGQRLVKNLDSQHFPYQFFILDRDEPNAFSLPGGYVYITRGLLAMINSEDELAGVLAHEIIHSHSRHAIRQMKKSIIPGILQIPGNIASGVLGQNFGSLINAPITIGSGVLLASYSRKHEKEADQLGMELAAKAGYRPGDLSVILSNVNKELELLTGQPEKKSYFRDHPYTPDRIEYISKTSNKLSVTNTPPVVPETIFLQQLEGIIIGQNPDQGILKDDTLIHPKLQLYYVFPDKWQVINTPVIVGAIAPDQEAYLWMKTIKGKKEKPTEIADTFYKGIKDKEVEIIQNRPLNINGLEAFLITLKILHREKDVFFQAVWIQKDSIIYNIQGAGYQNRLAEIQSSTESFRQTTEGEIKGLEYSVLQIVEARKGESLTNLLDRFDSEKKPELIAIMNNLKNDTLFVQPKKIKVIKKKKYGN